MAGDRAAASLLQSDGTAIRIMHGRGKPGESVHATASTGDSETQRARLSSHRLTISGRLLEDFGVRSEINMIVGARDASVTGPVQNEIVVLA